ncbi:iron-siderophore ABC transporter substrate-binding protein [Pseudonocardia sp. GCM10023141]|uniref:iron-siderophore ABC transporter substrate-binding protein n=1 Tax=Pseudonocardia sp. GCM10023141 TaxID=3252653 RepID=UPI00361E6F40
MNGPRSHSWRLLTLALATLFAVTACGSSGTPAAGGSAPTAPGAFPAHVTHKFGTTDVPAAPKRVVSLGYTDQDAILALGVVPVAIREFTGMQPSATWPWAQDKLQGQQPEVLQLTELKPEAIAALRPDLIVAISAGLTKDQYDLLSKIAPTISQPAEFVDYGTPWQQATRMTGAALGKSAEADKLVTDLEGRLAAVKSQFPKLVGKTVAGARPSTAGGNYFVWGQQDLRAQFFKAIGMPVPAEFDKLAGDKFYADISTEQLALLDTADAVVVITSSDAERKAFAGLSGYPALKSVKDNHIITLDDRMSAALSFGSVLSLPEVLDKLPAQLNASVGAA